MDFAADENAALLFAHRALSFVVVFHFLNMTFCY